MNEKEIVNPAFLTYAKEHSKQNDELLDRIHKETHLEEISPIMISSPFQGQLLYFLTTMIRPKKILEIGTFTGYSAICMGRALEEGATLTSIENNSELESKVNRYISEAKLSDKVKVIIGDAIDVIENLDGPFDMVFIDADKPNYLNYYKAIFPKLRKGAYIIADNVLWFGQVLTDSQEKSTVTLKAYNQMVKNDDRVEQILIPMGDGLNIARKLV